MLIYVISVNYKEHDLLKHFCCNIEGSKEFDSEKT